MNKRFTKLIAALALLVFMTPSLTGWGQTRETKTDVLNRDLTGVSGTSYSNWSGKQSVSDAVWAGNSAGGNDAIQLRSNNSNSGIVTTTSGGTVTKVTVTWESNTQSGRTLNVYGKNTAYSYASDLYGNNAGTLIGTIVCGTSTTLEITDSYTFIGMRSASGAMYLTTINVEWETGGSTPTVAAPTFSPANGTTFEETLQVTLSQADNKDIYYNINSESDPDANSTHYTGPFSINTTSTIKAIAIDGENTSSVATATYTKLTFTNIENISAAGNYAVKGTIVAKSTRGFVVGDGTGYIYYYNTSYDQNAYAIGNMVKLSGAVSAYGSVFQYTSTATVTEASESNYQTEEPLFITGSAMQTRVGSTDNTLSSYIQYEGTLSVSGTYYNITGIDGATTAQGSISYPINTDFTSLNGKTVTVTGYFVGVSSSKYYNTMLGSIEEVVSNEPSITVTPATINAPFAGAEGTLTVTYENITTVAANVYFCNAAGTEATYDWVTASVNETNNVDYLIEENEGEARTAYLKVWAYDDDMNEVYSDIVTINQAEYVAPSYAELPFEFNSGKAAIEETDGLSQEGLGSDYNTDNTKLKFDHTGDWLLLQFNERPGTLTFDIKNNSFSDGTFTVQTSEDGVTYTDLETYTEITGTQNEEFTDLGENVRYIKWIYTNKSSGNVGLGNIALAKYVEPVFVPSITVTPELVEVDAAEHEGTLGLAYENLEISDMNDFIVVYFDNQGGSIDDPDWIVVSVAEQDSQIGEGYVVSYYMLENEGEARSAFFKVIAADGEDFVYSNLVTVNQAAYVTPVTSGTGTITFGSAEGSTKINSTSVTGDDNLGNTWTVTSTFGSEGESFTQNASYSQVGAAKKPATSITFTATLPAEATISAFEAKFGGFSGTAGTITLKVGEATVGTGALNETNDVVVSSLPMVTGTVLTVTVTDIEKGVKCYYISYTLGAETYPLNISAYGETEGGYYLIASPVTFDPATVENMIYAGEDASNYDLYSFDQTQNEEWRNYKVDNFNLVPGKGYLYANKTNGSFSLTGAPYSGDGTIELTYDEAADFAGWNLIGNPFSNEATLNAPFYRMNEGGAELSAEMESGSIVNAMEGVFVIAESDGQTVTFSTENNSKAVEQVVMNVTRNRGTAIDRAIVRFDEGQQLPKFQLNPNNTKLYIAQGNKDYAIVRSAAQGEMPVSFRAAENGTYTLSVEPENVEMNYLHLIDNMTGMDVDLLQTPNYTFEAKTSDYASRFRLVFSANGIDEQNAETFAYFNGSEWVVSNTGEATLQVVDVMGRVLSTETITGNAELSLDQPAGVYMLRLINGNDVKVQKVVVR